MCIYLAWLLTIFFVLVFENKINELVTLVIALCLAFNLGLLGLFFLRISSLEASRGKIDTFKRISARNVQIKL